MRNKIKFTKLLILVFLFACGPSNESQQDSLSFNSNTEVESQPESSPTAENVQDYYTIRELCSNTKANSTPYSYDSLFYGYDPGPWTEDTRNFEYKIKFYGNREIMEFSYCDIIYDDPLRPNYPDCEDIWFVFDHDSERFIETTEMPDIGLSPNNFR